MDSLVSLSSAPPVPLAPHPARGANRAQPDAEELRQLLASQGLQSLASGGAPSETEARIAAAQIASKANVNAGVKRDRVLAGMDTAAMPAPAAIPGRFMPLRQNATTARVLTPPVSQNAANTVAGLRATTKFAPGPLTNPNLAHAVPAAGQALKRAPAAANADVSPLRASELYSYGLRAASEIKLGASREPPAWFEGAVTTAMDKYQGMKAAPKP